MAGRGKGGVDPSYGLERSQIKAGMHIIFRQPDVEARKGVVINDKADGALYPVRCEDGSSALVKRTEMKADPNAVVPKASPTLMKGEKYNIVASADFWAKMALEDAVKECGGQIVPNEGADAYSIWSGSDSDLIPKVGDEALYSRKLIWSIISAGGDVSREQYKLRPKAGTHLLPTGKQAYSKAEDKAMLDFLQKIEKSKPNLKAMGDAIWKDAEKAKITSRSWQSMKNRFKNELQLQYFRDRSERRKGRSSDGGGSSVSVRSKVENEVEEIDSDDGGKEEVKTTKKGSPKKRHAQSEAGAAAALLAAAAKLAEEQNAKDEQPVAKAEGGKRKQEVQASPDRRKKAKAIVKGGGGDPVVVDMANLDATPEDKAALVNDEIQRIMSSAGVAHSVAIHAAIVSGGNFSLAEKYLKLQLPLTEPASKHAETHGLWGVADDFTLINHEAVFRYYMGKHGLKSFPKLDKAAVAKADPDSDITVREWEEGRVAVKALVDGRSVEKCVERFDWIHAT